jgi:hypothetical protein
MEPITFEQFKAIVLSDMGRAHLDPDCFKDYSELNNSFTCEPFGAAPFQCAYIYVPGQWRYSAGRGLYGIGSTLQAAVAAEFETYEETMLNREFGA